MRSGDPDNAEAQAAQTYWPAMFGARFRRDRDAGGINACLNYGYAVVRAATARAICAAGLHPSIGIFHKSAGDALRLSDDLMEPFRPAVDLLVRTMPVPVPTVLDPATKRRLASVIELDYPTEGGRSPMSVVLLRLAQALAQVYLGTGTKLDWPTHLVPLHDSDGGEL